MGAMHSLIPSELVERIDKVGYYPELVVDALGVALADETVAAYLVHGETTFDSDSVRRHLSVLVLTGSRLVFVHADDHSGDDFAADDHGATTHAIATSEAIPLGRVGPVMITHVVPNPRDYRSGDAASELTLTVSWGAVSRIDLEPASCGDPHCEADHGLTGMMTGDDLSLRISAQADGPVAVREALVFARALSAATVGSPR